MQKLVLNIQERHWNSDKMDIFWLGGTWENGTWKREKWLDDKNLPPKKRLR